jgi:hypothetical protein
LTSAQRVTADYPLPAEYRPATGTSDDPPFIQAIMPTMATAVLAKHGTGPRSAQSYRDAIAQSAAEPDLTTVLTYFEYILHFGEQSAACAAGANGCTPMREVVQRAAQRDPRVSSFITALNGQNQNPARSVELWSALRSANPPAGHVLDVMIANVLSQRGAATSAVAARRELLERAETHFLSALQANPYLGSLYKDIGDHFMRLYRADAAWTCFDAGRALPGSPVAATLRQIDEYEMRLAAQNPQFY